MRRKKPERIQTAINVAFREGQKNLTEVLTRLNEKVNRKEEVADVTTTVEQNIETLEASQQQQEQLDEATALADFLDGLYN